MSMTFDVAVTFDRATAPRPDQLTTLGTNLSYGPDGPVLRLQVAADNLEAALDAAAGSILARWPNIGLSLNATGQTRRYTPS